MKRREDYSEELNNYYSRLERSSNEVIDDFESKNRSKSAEQMLDTVHNFFSLCYHLREWVQEDEKVPVEVKSKIPLFEGERAEVQFLICRDLCNKSKHSKLKYKPNDINTKIVQYGGAVFIVPIDKLNEINKKGETAHAKEENSIFLGNFFVSFRDKNYDLKGVVEGSMYLWKKFFNENNLLMPNII